MEVFLVPVGTGHYELYSEVPDEPPDLAVDASKGLWKRLQQRFRIVLASIEREHGHDRPEPPATSARPGWTERVRNRVLRWAAERVAEQRLLWHLRAQKEATIVAPDDLPADRARDTVRSLLQQDVNRHGRWFVVNAVALVLSGLLAPFPGPNLVAYYFAFRLVGHYLSMRGAQRGLSGIVWHPSSSPELTKLRGVGELPALEQEREVDRISRDLGLRRLPKFYTRIAARVTALILAAVVSPWSAPAEGAVPPPKLQYQVLKLPNGLTVILSEDHSVPIVHLELWYHVGSKDERPGRTGFAHLFEHLMFKGSKNVEPEAHASLLSSVGGMSNAYTTEDVTVFWETVPAQYLPLALWLEADRMATLRIDKDSFSREREVVKEERRMRVENQPYGLLSEILYDQAFTVHPYKHTTIGRMADLEAASVEDVRDFYRTYYVPNNATLALVGDLDAPQAIQLVSEYLGRVPRSDRPIPRDTPQEPPPLKEKRVTLTENWPLPVIVVAHHITYDGHPDSYPLHMAAKILSDGQSSRIYRTLVYERGIALAAFGSGNIVEEPNLFFTAAIVQPGHTLEEAEKALVEELERLKNEPVGDRELERARNQFARDYIMGRETDQQKATALAHAAVIHKGDISTADGEFDVFMRITPADIQRVARTYFTPERRVVLKILPATPSARGGARR